MIISGRHIDHLVYCVMDLDLAMQQFEQQSGIKPTVGGQHLNRGTKNALIDLGNECYFELLATDKTNQNISAPRWMGIDLLRENKVTRWCLKSNDLQADLEQLNSYNSKLAQLSEGNRKLSDDSTLSWEMTTPLAFPEVELMPFMINWKKNDGHPTDGLIKGCQLLRLDLYHNQTNDEIVNSLNNFLPGLGLQRSKETKIKATISSPKGTFIL